MVFVAGLAAGAGLQPGAAKAAPARKHINLRGSDAGSLPFSDAVLVGDTLYLAGRIGTKPGTREVPATAEEEAKLVLDQYKDVLAAAGMTMDDLVALCALLDKLGRREVDVPVDYAGFVIPSEFVVGYGLDHAGLYRNLPDIAALEGIA